MNRRERLMATLSGKPVDRPAVNFYEIGGFKVDPSDPDQFNIYNDPSWKPLLDLAEQQTDLIRMRSPVRPRSHEVTSTTPQSGTCRDEFFKTGTYTEKGCLFTFTNLKIAGRNMTSLTRAAPKSIPSGRSSTFSKALKTSKPIWSCPMKYSQKISM